ncbi:MAG: hypothetical protein ACI8T1_003387, partial [Verrucomicrobiales bacterium]
NHPIAFTGFTDQVTADPPAGFYGRFPKVSLINSKAEAEIRYTTDGSLPSSDSSIYKQPITMLFGGDVVIRAQTYIAGRAMSPVVTQSYLTERTFNMPVVSLTTAPEHLWDDDLGIYTPGRNSNEGGRVANYWNEWERPIHVEFFEPDGTLGFTADAGLRILGWGSRSNPQKSLAVMFRDRYGVDQLQYRLFPDEEIEVFNSFVLRAAGSDSRANGTFFRDPFASSLLTGRNVDKQAFRPAVVYINGDYWGIQNIREKMNEDYLASHHNIDPKNVDVISRYWRRRHPVVIEGDNERYLAFEAFLEANDFSNASAYEEAQRHIELDNFIEYIAAQIYLANFDWPGNNNKNWMPRTDDGRWRWLMYDLDYSFGFDGSSNFRFNTLAHAMAPSGTGWPNPGWTTLILRKLAENEGFQHAFANRVADLSNSRLGAVQAIPKLDTLRAHYASEMEHHINRWKREGQGIPSLDAWESNIGTIRTFLQRRQAEILEHVRAEFQLGEITEVKLEIDDSTGQVKLNSVTIHDSNWTGRYFDGVPITLTALPKPGYRFATWEGLDLTESSVTLVPSSITNTLKPVFERAPAALNKILISEINYHSSADQGSGDWVELRNTFGQPIDLSGWVFQDGSTSNRFFIPVGTTILPDEVIVLCEDQDTFRSIHPDVVCAGSFGFGLSNSGERLRLLDAEGQLIDEVTYKDAAPWPTEADGAGATLVLTDAVNATWKSAPDQGTPGIATELVADAIPPSLGIRKDGAQLFLEFDGDPEVSLERSDDLQLWRQWVGDSLIIENASPAEYFRIRK